MLLIDEQSGKFRNMNYSGRPISRVANAHKKKVPAMIKAVWEVIVTLASRCASLITTPAKILSNPKAQDNLNTMR
jgi:hypothetical protein